MGLEVEGSNQIVLGSIVGKILKLNFGTKWDSNIGVIYLKIEL